ASMLEDAGVAVVVTTRALRPRVPAVVRMVMVDEAELQPAFSEAVRHNPTDGERRAALRPQHPAYLIYTSGSTGAPQGGPNTPAGGANRLLWMHAAPRRGGAAQV